MKNLKEKLIILSKIHLHDPVFLQVFQHIRKYVYNCFDKRKGTKKKKIGKKKIRADESAI